MENGCEDLFGREIENLRVQFKDRLLLLEENDVKCVYRVSGFKTSDPDFPKNVLKHGITLLIHFPRNFPEKKPRLKVNKDNLTIKESSSIKILNERIYKRCIRLRAQPGQYLRNCVKFIDRLIASHKPFLEIASIETQLHLSMLQNEEWTLNQQTSLEGALGEFLMRQGLTMKEKWLQIARKVPGKNAEQCLNRYKKIREDIVKAKQDDTERNTKSVSNVFKEKKEDAEEAEDSVRENIEVISMLPLSDYNSLPSNSCSKIAIDGLENTNVLFLQPSQVEALLQCLYCSTVFERSLKIGKHNVDTEKFWCSKKKCGHVLSYSFKTVALHEMNKKAVAAVIGEHLSVVDVQSISFMASCEFCDNQELVKSVTRGQPKQVNCKGCFKKLRILYQAISVHDNREPIAKHTQIFQKKQAKDPRIKLGSALPRNGSCQHYRKSHRWLRFPCCNRAFPCDVCHDIEAQCEDTRRANRMICGYCACEQPFSNDKPCKKCGKTIGPQKRTSHWEGGKGCRNQKLMSTKDKKKYSGSKNKTRSNKENRVGPKTHRK